MLKMSQKMRQTSRTFMMEGMAPRRAFTTTCVNRHIKLTKCHEYCARKHFVLQLIQWFSLKNEQLKCKQQICRYKMSSYIGVILLKYNLYHVYLVTNNVENMPWIFSISLLLYLTFNILNLLKHNGWLVEMIINLREIKSSTLLGHFRVKTSILISRIFHITQLYYRPDTPVKLSICVYYSAEFW